MLSITKKLRLLPFRLSGDLVRELVVIILARSRHHERLCSFVYIVSYVRRRSNVTEKGEGDTAHLADTLGTSYPTVQTMSQSLVKLVMLAKTTSFQNAFNFSVMKQSVSSIRSRTIRVAYV